MIKGKPLARPYAQAVMAMLPKTTYDPDDRKSKRHESINDLQLHAATGQQIFWPTSESRHFTRMDAAKTFDDTLLPADDRVPHPELALEHRDAKARLSNEEREAGARKRQEVEDKRRLVKSQREAQMEAAIKKIDTPRCQFRIEEIRVDHIGKDGRGRRGVGWRYGVPLMDRSRGHVKIPTSVG